MLKSVCYAVALAVSAPALPAFAAEPVPIEVMVLGTFHFGNPGADLNNSKVEDVLVPKRQAELADLVERLARFKPAKVAIENQPATADLSVPGYAKFTLAELAKQRNENVQIGGGGGVRAQLLAAASRGRDAGL